MKKYLFFISIFFISCQDEITLDLPQAENKLVIEGAIENGFPPYIIITKNQGYFDPISDNPLLDIIVNDAIVKVWTYDEDGRKDSVMLEQLPPPLDSTFIYTDINLIDNSGLVDFLGEAGKTYYLEINWNNQIITSETTIPNPTPLDCLWVQQSETADKDFKCDIRALYSDPADQQNNILIKSKRLEHYTFNEDSCTTKKKEDFPFQFVDAGSDVLINGQSFETYFPKPKENGFPTGAYNSSHERECDDGSTLELKEDIVLIKFCQIDEPSMKFWRGLIRQVGTNGNPFAEPMNLLSNINGGLGVFTGYGTVYYKVPIIKGTTIDYEYSPNIIDIF